MSEGNANHHEKAEDPAACLSASLQRLQIQMLLGLDVDEDAHLPSVLRQRSDSVLSLAQTYDDFYASGLDFAPARYRDQRFLDMYLAHYTPRYVLALQQIFRELETAGLFRPGQPVVDVGVGPGTTLLALADYCAHAPQTGPSYNGRGMHYWGVDLSGEALRYARRVAAMYRADLERELTRASADRRTALKDALHLLGLARYRQGDGLAGFLTPERGQQLVIYANVLAELAKRERWDELLAEQLSRLTVGSLVLFLEPAEESQARRLAAFRRTLLGWGVAQPFLPCSYDLGPRESGRCHACWSIRDTNVTRSVLDAALDPVGRRRDNHPWTYAVLSVGSSPPVAAREAVELRCYDGEVVPARLLDRLPIVGRLRSGPRKVCSNRFTDVEELLVSGDKIALFRPGDCVDLAGFTLKRSWRAGLFELEPTPAAEVVRSASPSLSGALSVSEEQ